MDKKKIIIIGAIIAILLSVAVVIYASNKETQEPDFTIDGINLPTNKEILNDASVDELKITNVSLLTRNGISTFKATIKNETDNQITIKKLYAIFYEGETENKKLLSFDTTIPSGTEIYIDITSESDLSNTTRIEYVLE